MGSYPSLSAKAFFAYPRDWVQACKAVPPVGGDGVKLRFTRSIHVRDRISVIRQVVCRRLWESDIGCSIHPSRTKKQWKMRRSGLRTCLENRRLAKAGRGSTPPFSTSIKNGKMPERLLAPPRKRKVSQNEVSRFESDSFRTL